MADFYAMLTTAGKAKLANAQATGVTVQIANFAVGDGNGAIYNPNEAQVALAKEVYRAGPNRIAVDENNPNWLVVELVVPEDVGGFYVREAGLFDDTGAMIAIAKYPETYKPTLAQGSGKDLYIRMILEFSNPSGTVTLKVDPAIVLATKKNLLDHEASRNHPDATTAAKGMVELATPAETVAGVDAVRAATPAGVAAAIAALVAAAPGALDTLNELAAALGNDANFSATIAAQLAQKLTAASDAEAAALAINNKGITPANLAALFAKSHGANGYQKMAGGLILQWGTVSGSLSGDDNVAVTFPIAFPNACHLFLPTLRRSNTSGAPAVASAQQTAGASGPTTTGGSIRFDVDAAFTAQVITFNWLALGN